MLEEVFYYGRIHKYWANWTIFCNASKSLVNQVEDIMFQEEYGMSRAEYQQLALSDLEDDAARRENKLLIT